MKKIYITLLALAFCLTGKAQLGIINTVAGNGNYGYSGDGGQATSAELYDPWTVVFDASGNMYISDYDSSRIRKVNTAGIISTLAGNGASVFGGDGGQATAAELKYPHGIAIDVFGNLYLADQGNNRIRKVNTSGIITTIAGTGSTTYVGDGGQATATGLFAPTGLTFDDVGNLYVADFSNNAVRKINTLGIISTIAGEGFGFNGYTGDGGQATAAQISQPSGLAFDVSGNLYISSVGSNVIRKVNTLGIITTVAGHGTCGGTSQYCGDGGQATAAKLNGPSEIAIDAIGNLYIVDGINSCIRMVNTASIISTICGNGTAGRTGDGGPAVNATLDYPSGIAIDASGNLYIADNNNNEIRKITCMASLIVPSNAYTIFDGSSQTFSVSGANTYTWSPAATLSNANIANPIANPTTTTVYSVTGTNSSGCSNLQSPVTITVTVNPSTILSGTTCSNAIPICSNYSISTMAASASGQVPNCFSSAPQMDMFIQFTVSQSGTLAWKAMPNITTDEFDWAIWNITTGCPGSIICCNYNYAGGSSLGFGMQAQTGTVACGYNSVSNTPSHEFCAPINVTAGQIYAIQISNSNATGNGFSLAFTNSTCQLSSVTNAIVSPATICAGGSTSLTASGVINTYTWMPVSSLNNANIANPIANPTTTTVYTVSGTAIGCGPSAPVTVTVNVVPLPTVTVTGNTVVCSGDTTTLTASGATTYTWSNTGETSASIIPSPTVTTNYTVTGTDVNNCMNTDTISIIVNNCTTGFNKLASNNELNIYPNPNNGSFVIELQNTLYNVHCTVYNVNGKVVLSQNINGKTSIDASTLNEGVYNISLQSNEGVVNKRVVIVR
jgi:sugar lactone lactonase YvrE